MIIGWLPTGAWEGPYGRHPARWQGREQVEDKSEANIRQCYRFLRSLPYQSVDDRARLDLLELIAITEQKMTSG